MYNMSICFAVFRDLGFEVLKGREWGNQGSNIIPEPRVRT